MVLNASHKNRLKIVLWPKNAQKAQKLTLSNQRTVGLFEILRGPIGPDVDPFVRLVLADVGQLGVGQVLETVQRRRAFSRHPVGQDIARDLAAGVGLLGFKRLLGRLFAAEAAKVGQASEGRDVLAAELEVLPEPVGGHHVGPICSSELQLSSKFRT